MLILLARIHLALTRFFDVDEFAHLHWTYLTRLGQFPYRDFFFYNTPVYQWFLLPLFLLPERSAVLLLARLWQFALYLLTLAFLFRISERITTRPVYALLALLVFTTFPMTFDKTIDVRPDMLMLALFLFGVDTALSRHLSPDRLVVIGLSFGASFIVLMKAVVFIPAGLLLIFLCLPEKKRLGNMAFVMAGMAIPILGFWTFLARAGLARLAWEAYTHTSVVVNAGKQGFSPLAALSPWPLVYIDRGVVSLAWLLNSGLWVLAAVGLALLWRRNRPFLAFTICLLALTAFFLFLFPAPYLQYFLPASVLASILAAAALETMQEGQIFPWVRSTVGSFVMMSFVIVLLVTSFFQQYAVRLRPENQNSEQLAVIDTILTISKPTDPVYDMVGSYVFRPDGYFICCHPYAEFVDRLKRKPPTLRESLVATNTTYLILDRTGASLWLPKPDDLSYILASYAPSMYPKIYIRR